MLKGSPLTLQLIPAPNKPPTRLTESSADASGRGAGSRWPMQGPAGPGQHRQGEEQRGPGPGGFPQQQGQLPGVVGDGRTGRQDGVQVQLSADHVAGVAQHGSASTRRADYGGGAQNAGPSLSMVASRYWASTVTVLPFSTALAGMVKLSAL